MGEKERRIVDSFKNFVYTDKNGQERSMFEDTVFVFSSDNGGMSDGLGYGGASNFPLNGRKGDLWEGGTRAPAFLYNMQAMDQGVTDQLFHITDWLPTIYTGLSGGSIVDLGDIDGVNQLESEPQRSEILYDIANFQDTNFTFFVDDSWPGSFEMASLAGICPLTLICVQF